MAESATRTVSPQKLYFKQQILLCAKNKLYRSYEIIGFQPINYKNRKFNLVAGRDEEDKCSKYDKMCHFIRHHCTYTKFAATLLTLVTQKPENCSPEKTKIQPNYVHKWILGFRGAVRSVESIMERAPPRLLALITCNWTKASGPRLRPIDTQ